MLQQSHQPRDIHGNPAAPPSTRRAAASGPMLVGPLGREALDAATVASGASIKAGKPG